MRTNVLAAAAALVPLAAAPLLGLAAAPPVGLATARAAAQSEGAADPAKQIAKYERYLERRPYHESAFEQLVDAAVQSNRLASLVEQYEERTREGGTVADRVIAARLLARVDRVDEALERLAAIEDAPAEMQRLVGALELRRGRTAAAVLALDAAVAATDDRLELESLHRLRGEARLAAGDLAAAAAAFRDLSALDPEDFQLRLEAAATMARHGLASEALVELEEAKRIAADDAARRCRVLADIGRLHEQLGDGDAALAVYAEAIGSMARGNWLKRDLQERVVALHRRSSTLEELVARAAAAATPGDLDALEFHARALTEVGRAEEALGVLAAAAVTFPGDVALARSRIELLRRAGDTAAVIAEYQRILAERPEELDLYIELGQTFAAGGQLEQARLQWQKTLGDRLDDPGLASRLASLYALYGQHDDAIALYERASALEPGEMSRYGDLAAYLGAIDRKGEVEAVLARAEAAAGASPEKLDEAAGLWQEFGAPERARAILERALATAPDDVRLLRRLADTELAAGDLERATRTLHRVIDLAPEAGTRRTAVDRIARAWLRAGREDDLVEAERLAHAEPGASRSHGLVLGRTYARRRDTQSALDVYTALIERSPELEEARESAAKLLEEAGELELALAQYEALVELRPQNRRKYLADIASLHLERYDQEAAFQCYSEILASSPDNAAAFREVGAAYDKLGLTDEAIECYLQAVRLEPGDGRTRLDLAELFYATGEWDRAEREIVAAFDSKDESSRKRARERFHVLLSQEGRLESEIADLRERISRNPYDTASPVTLTDLYVREMEFQLALDMLDSLLAYQPTEIALLTERARILGHLERHGEAIETLETIWKLPGADQRELTESIADAHIKKGDRAKAEEVLAPLGDPESLARLYQRNDLTELAIEVLAEARERRPSDLRLLDRLSRLQESVLDREGAIANVERMVELQGDSWRLLTRLGTLYFEAGRQEDAFAIGARLFGLIRIADAPEPPKDESDAPPAARRNQPRVISFGPTTTWARGPAADQRVDELRNWYQGIGGTAQFTSTGIEELRRQPTNDKLLMVVVSELTREEGRGADLAALLRDVRAATLGAGKLPAGVSEAEWTRTLDSYAGRVATKDTAFGRARAAELEALAAAGGAPAELHVELADLYVDLRENEACLAALRAGVAAHPDSAPLRAGLAEQLQRERKFADAAEHWRVLVDALVASGASDLPLPEEAELEYRRARTALLRAFPIHLQRRLSEDDLRRHHALSRYRHSTTSWALGSRPPSANGARAALARCLHEIGDDAGARAEILALEAALEAGETESEDPASLPLRDVAMIASLWAELDFDAEAKAAMARLQRIEDALSAHPVHGFNRSWVTFVRRGKKELAAILEREGDVAGAYDVLRESGFAAEGKLLLEENAAFDVAAEHYRARAEALASDPASLSAWRDEMVKLAEVHQHARRFDECLAAYEAVVARAPEDFAVREAIARLHERANRWEDAVATHEAIVAGKRAANRRSERPSAPPGDPLVPFELPRQTRDTSWVWSNLQSAGRMGGSAAGKHSLIQNYGAILELLLDNRRVERATEILAQIAREDARNFSWLGSSLAQIVEQYRFEAEGIPILRLLYSHDRSDDYLALRYGNALMSAKRFDEARRVFREILESASGNSYVRDEATRQLAVADGRLGKVAGETREDLEAAVARDPKNAKARTKLASLLLAEREDERALEHATAALEVAPHLEDVRFLACSLLQLTGRQAELEAHLLEEFEGETDHVQRLAKADVLATWMAERGDDAAVEALFAKVRAKAKTSYSTASIGDWYLARGDTDRAIRELERDLATADPRYHESIRRRIATVAAQAGDPTASLELAWQAFDRATAKGDRETAFLALARAIEPTLDDPEATAAVEAAIERWGGAEGTAGRELLEGALEIARGELAAAEARLGALARADRGAAFVYPILVEIARARDDLPAAVAHLEELQALGIASESTTVMTSIDAIAEADALRAEIGCLRLELGDRAGADAAWGEMFEPDDAAGWRSLSKLYAEMKLFPEAVAALERSIAESGAHDVASLEALADLHYQAGDASKSLATFERVLVLVEADATKHREVTTRVMRLYRELGRLDDRRAALRARIAADPDDVVGQLELARLEAEAGDEEAARAVLESLVERPSQLEAVAPVLVRAALARGDFDDACRWYERLIAGNDAEWERRQHVQAYAKVLVDRGDLEGAYAATVGAYPDPEGTEALEAALSLFQSERELERALEVVAKLESQTTKPERWLRTRIELLASMDRTSEAQAAVREALADPHVREDWMLDRYRTLDEDGEELRRVEAELAAAPDDPGAMIAWVALADPVKEAERRAAILARLCETQPDDVLLRSELASALAAAKRREEALSALETLLEQLDRERARDTESPWQGANEIEQARTRRVAMVYDLRGVEAATAASSDRLGRRYARLETDRLRDYSYEQPDPPAGARLDAIRTYGTDDELLAELASRGGRARTLLAQDAALRSHVWEIRYRRGEREAVIAEIRAAALEEPNPLLDATNDQHVSFTSTGVPYLTSMGAPAGAAPAQLDWNHPLRRWIDYAREEGRLDELASELEGHAAKRPEDEMLTAALAWIEELRATDRPSGAMGEGGADPDSFARERERTRLEAAIEKDPYDQRSLLALAKQRLADGEPGAALELLERAAPITRGHAYSGLDERVTVRHDAGRPKAIRFHFASSNMFRSSSGYTTWNNRSDGGSGELEQLLAAAHFLVGDRAAGLAHEERARRLLGRRQYGWYDPLSGQWHTTHPLLRVYADAGVRGELERLAAAERESIEKETRGNRSETRRRLDGLADQMIAAYAESAARPRDPRRDAWIAERRAAFDRYVEEETESTQTRITRATWLLEAAEDEAAAREDVAWLMARPDWADRKPSIGMGWLLVRLGDVAGARRELEGVLAAEERPRSVTTCTELEAGLALCRHIEGDEEGARPELMRAYVRAFLTPPKRLAVRRALGLEAP